MKIGAEFPTKKHEQASKAVVNFFSAIPEVEAVILYGSCARMKATKDSCLDILVLVPPNVLSTRKVSLEEKWKRFYETVNIFKRLLKVGKYSHVDLVFIDGCFVPKEHSWTTGPDDFELEIGNTLVYSISLWQRGDRLTSLKSEWLPFYNDKLRFERLAMVMSYCQNNLDHIPLYAKRGLYFQSFDRFYNAFQEFLQALFISRRIYPIAYDKWIQEQIEEILGLPDLYASLVQLFKIKSLISDEIEQKAKDLNSLLQVYIKR